MDAIINFSNIHLVDGYRYNEKLRLAERYKELNVAELIRAAAQSIQIRDTHVRGLSKLAEGGFNHVLQSIMNDNTQILARLPYPSIQLKQLAVASEVATWNLLRAHGFPVPRVHAYSADANNPIGSEYIIMEKLPGRPLGDIWVDMSDNQRLKVLLQPVQLETKRHAIELPANTLRIDIPDSDFCTGPFATLRWWFGERATLAAWTQSIFRDAALKELTWLRAYGRPRFPFECAYRETMKYQLSLPSDHMRSLEKYLKSLPLLRHPALQRNNIFVLDDFEIVGLTDWQHASVLPLFLAAGIPKFFQNYDDPESHAFRLPPPPDLEGMDDEEKAFALEDFLRRHTHFFYLAFTRRFNEPHFQTIQQSTNMLTRRIFNHAGEPWEGNNIPLQNDLVLVIELWHEYSTGPCPISFFSAEAKSFMQLQDMQEDVDLPLKRVRKRLAIV
ncbi:hypothetical protein BDV12DRAFT_184728 [Aspergillus spectabilis]